MYAKIQNNTPVEWPVHDFQIRSAMTTVSLPAQLKPEDVAPLGFEPYAESEKPEFDPLVQDVQESAPIMQGGTWVQSWDVVELYDAAQRARVLADAEAKSHAIAKSSKHEAVNAERNRRETAGFPYQGKTLDSDPVSVQRITVAVQAAQAALSAGQPFAVEWVCADNTTLALDAAGLIGMPVALAAHANALHMHGRSLKAQITAATNAAELDAIDVLTGWPA
jgi:Domain of unknown function (DUF4376)